MVWDYTAGWQLLQEYDLRILFSTVFYVKCTQLSSRYFMKKDRIIVISLMKRNANILAGQEIRWGRIAKALEDVTDFKIKILCTKSMWESWEKYGLGKILGNIEIFEEHPNKYITWIKAQFFALRVIPFNSLLHIPGPGWLIAPAVVFSKFLKGCSLITSLTTCKIKPLKKVSYREYIISLTLSRIANLVDTLNPSIDLDGLIDKKKVTVSPCSFSDPARYFPSEIKKTKVVFAAHLQANKGVDILIEIMKIWPQNSTNELIICGASDISSEVRLQSSLIRKIAESNKNIKLIETDNMAEVFSDARVFLSLQTWDNYPSQSLIEAMLSGCNIIATDVGDTSLLVKKSWGIMLPVNAPATDYLASINKFLSQPDEIQRVSGLSARQFILANHTVEIYVDYLKKIWRSIK